MAALGLSSVRDVPLAYGPAVREDLLMLEVSEDILLQLCSNG